MKPTILAVLLTLDIAPGLRAETPTAPETGKVLLLDNDLIIEGEITRVRDEYSVKRDGAGEALIPAGRVVKLVQTKAEAFEILRKKVKSDDFAAHVKLARWGLIHQLHPEALEEAETAAKLRPDDAQAKVLVKGLKQLIDKPIAVNLPEQKSQGEEETTIPTAFNATAFGPFANRVQPLLMNLCAGCHATGKGGNYKLVRVFEASGNRKGTLQNLSATLGQINRDNPSASALLAKAVAAHGDSAKSPIADPKAGSFALLEEWTMTAMRKSEDASAFGERTGFASNKPIFVEAEETVKRPAKNPPLIGGNVPLRAEEESQTPKAAAKPATGFGADLPPVAKKEKEKDKEPPVPKDEFDPAIFNQQTVPPPKK